MHLPPVTHRIATLKARRFQVPLHLSVAIHPTHLLPYQDGKDPILRCAVLGEPVQLPSYRPFVALLPWLTVAGTLPLLAWPACRVPGAALRRMSHTSEDSLPTAQSSTSRFR